MSETISSPPSTPTPPHAVLPPPELRAALARLVHVIGLIGVVGSVLVMAASGFTLWRAWTWREGTVTAVGTVTGHASSASSIATPRRARGKNVAEIVRFTDASGVEHEFRSTISTSHPFAVGDPAPVRYTAADPTDAVIDTPFRTWGFPAIFLGAGAVLAAGGLVFLGIGRGISRVSAQAGA